MKKNTLLILFIFSCIPLFAAVDTASKIARLKAEGLKITCGRDSEAGLYILCKETVTIQQNDISLAQESAKLQARASIAEFISVKVSAVSKSASTSKESVNDENESFASTEVRAKFTKKDASQLQRGITVCSIERKGNSLTVYCLLLEKVVDATAQLENAMKKLGPDTVQVSGTAYYGENISKEVAEKDAIAEAQREAIAQVLGMSVSSSSARQTISKEGIDNQGEESFSCDDSFKAKVFSSTAGFVESFRVVDAKDIGNAMVVTIVAKVAKDKVMNDYRSYLESMGNPGFCVRSNSRLMLDMMTGFFGDLGLRMVDNVYDSAYIIDVEVVIHDDQLIVKVVVKDKVNEVVLFSQESESETLNGDSSSSGKIKLCKKALDSIKAPLHKKLNTFIGRANADGRKLQVKLNNYAPDEYKESIKIIEKALKMVPGATNVKMTTKKDVVIFTLNYKNEAEDLADFLEKHIETDIKRRSKRPERSKVQNTLVEFDFE